MKLSKNFREALELLDASAFLERYVRINRLDSEFLARQNKRFSRSETERTNPYGIVREMVCEKELERIMESEEHLKYIVGGKLHTVSLIGSNAWSKSAQLWRESTKRAIDSCTSFEETLDLVRELYGDSKTMALEKCFRLAKTLDQFYSLSLCKLPYASILQTSFLDKWNNLCHRLLPKTKKISDIRNLLHKSPFNSTSRRATREKYLKTISTLEVAKEEFEKIQLLHEFGEAFYLFERVVEILNQQNRDEEVRESNPSI